MEWAEANTDIHNTIFADFIISLHKKFAKCLTVPISLLPSLGFYIIYVAVER